MYKQRIDHQNLTGFVESANNAPDQGACQIHYSSCSNIRGNFFNEGETTLSAAKEWWSGVVD